MDAVSFIVLVGVLIFVHELGHFAWAKFFGVRVLTFSIGFGPRIAGFRRGETEYVLSAIPLGGYVKMLGESPTDHVSRKDEAVAFQNQALWKRIVIVTAGPAMNLLFPVALYFVVYLGESAVPGPVIGTVIPGRPAESRLFAGDRVLEINGDEVETFHDISRIVEDSAGKRLSFHVLRDGKEIATEVEPVLTSVTRPLDIVDRVGRIGIMPHQPAAILGVTSSASPAAGAGLRTFDRVVAVAGKPVDRFGDLERVFRGNGGSLVPLTYLRPTRVVGALGGLVELDVYEPRVAVVTPNPGAGEPLQRAGLEIADLYVSQVTVGSPEHRLGLLPGDRLVALDGRRLRTWSEFATLMGAEGDRPHDLTWHRDGVRMQGHLRGHHEVGVSDQGEPFDRVTVSIAHWVPVRVPELIPNPDRVTSAFSQSLASTGEMIELTWYSIVRLFQGRLSVKSIGGPLTMLEVAGSAARAGALNYLAIMAFISVNLGLINLLPIPMLDGGHLLFFTIEGAMRRKLHPRVRQYASLAGLALLLLLMGVAIKNDVDRRWFTAHTQAQP